MLPPFWLSVNPAVVTTFPLPTFSLSKVAVAPPETRVTTSPGVIVPTSTAPPVFNVAALVPLYTLLSAVTPVIVKLITAAEAPLVNAITVNKETRETFILLIRVVLFMSKYNYLFE